MQRVLTYMWDRAAPAEIYVEQCMIISTCRTYSEETVWNSKPLFQDYVMAQPTWEFSTLHSAVLTVFRASFHFRFLAQDLLSYSHLLQTLVTLVYYSLA